MPQRPVLSSVKGEQRRLHRVRLIRPREGDADGKRVFIIDLSLHGLRLAQQENPGAIGDTRLIRFEWEGRRAALRCELRWLQIQQNIGRASYAKSLFHAGYKIVEASDESLALVRDIVLEYVMRALDEQKANAKGVPALAAQSFQTGANREFLRHELLGGRWMETRTPNPVQPPVGFTIGADHSRDEIDMLREAYAAGDAAARQTIRMMAELSTSNESGIPTRKYIP